MKALLTSDWHTRYLPPENRLDKNFFEDVVMYKINQVIDIAREHDVGCIVQGGDLFDSPDPSRYVIARMLRMLRFAQVPIYTVIGQHDMYYRQLSDISRTATYLLESADVVTIVGLDQKSVYAGGGVFVSGLSFEQDFKPKPDKSQANAFNILVAHAMVGTKPLYPGHEIETVRQFVHKNPGFDVILLGDVHQEFSDEFAGTQVFNTGPLVRKTIDEKEHKPNVIIYDTETSKHTRIQLEYESWKNVFHIPEKLSKESQSRLDQFISLIKSQKQIKVSFEDNLTKFFKEHKVSKGGKAQISLALVKVGINVKELKEMEDNHVS